MTRKMSRFTMALQVATKREACNQSNGGFDSCPYLRELQLLPRHGDVSGGDLGQRLLRADRPPAVQLAQHERELGGDVQVGHARNRAPGVELVLETKTI